MSNKIRLRFAPSPTGPLHVGGLRTALFNYLLVKKLKGKFILRIEDTDQARLVEGSQKHIEDCLEWAGIKCDESPRNGGKYGPYKQSERKDIYLKYVNSLIKKGDAYYAFDTKEDLDAHRKNHELSGKTFIYNSHNRHKLKNSLTIKGEELKKELEQSGYVVRFKTIENRVVNCSDLIRGEVSTSTSEIDDKILLKSDGMPTYHLANVVDDHLMNISHVIRGEEWLPSLALHLLLYEALGWEKPKFAHLPLILKPVGKGKLSKRDGDKFGFPIYPVRWSEGDRNLDGFKEDGYLPAALNNYMAFLGWNNQKEKEVYLMDDLITDFSIAGINSSGAKFDPEKLLWINSQHIQLMSDNSLAEIISKEMNTDTKDSLKILFMIKPRLEKISKIRETFGYLLEKPDFDQKALSKINSSKTKEIINTVQGFFTKSDQIKEQELKSKLFEYLSVNDIKPGKAMPIIRVALVGKLEGPDLFDLVVFLGKKEVTRRVSFLERSFNNFTS